VAPNAPAGRVGSSNQWTVLVFAEGAAEALATCGSALETVAVMSEHILASALPIRAAVGHAAATSELAADALAAALASSGGVVEVERYRVGPAVGAHSGPFSFGAFWWPA